MTDADKYEILRLAVQRGLELDGELCALGGMDIRAKTSLDRNYNTVRQEARSQWDIVRKLVKSEEARP
jgi:hypothetical protein